MRHMLVVARNCAVHEVDTRHHSIRLWKSNVKLTPYNRYYIGRLNFKTFLHSKGFCSTRRRGRRNSSEEMDVLNTSISVN
jgi:hypothetical protein